jgi:hydrogenase small subunit
VTKWNGNLSYPIQSGHGCIGCSEKDFWDNGPFYQHLGSFPGFGIETTADTIGTVAAGVTVGGLALHAISSNIRKKSVIQGNMDESVTQKADASTEELKNGGDAS